LEPLILQSTSSYLITASLSILLRLALTGFAFTMIWLDIAVFNTQILEISFTEITQEVMLFACAMLFWCSPAAEGRKGFKMLAGGFFACLLMRELDGLFDPISHSAWCWPFVAIALFSVLTAVNAKNRAHTLDTLAAFTRTPAFGSLSTGLGVLVFSRVFGMGDLWHLILDEGYARLAKTTVEEGIELLTYSMWLAASVEFCLQRFAAAARARRHDHEGQGQYEHFQTFRHETR
jgi:hypothetical protein